MSIPAKFRDTLSVEYNSSKVALIRQDQCLMAYPQAEWEKLAQRVKALDPFDPNARNLKRSLLAGVHEVEVDNQGRVLVPPNLRTEIALDEKVVIIGSGETFEIWGEQKWQEFTKTPEGDGWSLAAQVFGKAQTNT